MGDVGDTFREFKDHFKQGRKKARDGASERILVFFIKNKIECTEGNNTILFDVPSGKVVYYPPSQRMQHKNDWKDCSPTYCMNYVKRLRGVE